MRKLSPTPITGYPTVGRFNPFHSLLHCVVELIGEFGIESLQNRELARHTILITETCVNKSQTVMGLRVVRLQLYHLLQGSERILGFTCLVAGVAQAIESFDAGWIQHRRLPKRIRGVIELAGAKRGCPQAKIRRFIIRFDLCRPLVSVSSFSEAAGVEQSLAQIVIRGELFRL